METSGKGTCPYARARRTVTTAPTSLTAPSRSHQPRGTPYAASGPTTNPARTRTATLENPAVNAATAVAEAVAVAVATSTQEVSPLPVSNRTGIVGSKPPGRRQVSFRSLCRASTVAPGVSA